MATAVEVVMPGNHPHVTLDLPPAARVVSAPSSRQNVARIVVAPLRALESIRAVEVLSRIRKEQGGAPLVFFGSGSGKTHSHRIALLQHLAIASGDANAIFLAPDKETVNRIVRAHLAGAEKTLIATARIDDGELLVWSCEPRLYRCSVSELAPLRVLSAASLAGFEISKSGSRLHWPNGDVDVTLESIQAIADPKARAQQERRYREAARKYAAAIRALREKQGLAQSNIEGLSDRAVRRVEQGERIPHSSTLKKLARAHGMRLDEYMAELARLSARRT